MKPAKRPWTRQEKWLWATPLLFVIGAGAALWGPTVVRKQLGRPVVLETAPNVLVKSIALSADGSTLAAAGFSGVGRGGSKGRTFFWDARTLKALPSLESPLPQGQLHATNFALALSPDGKLVTSASSTLSPQNMIFGLYQRKTQSEQWSIKGQFFDAIARFAPDGKTVCVSQGVQGGSELLVMRIADGKTIARWKNPDVNSESSAFCWSPDGTSIAYIRDKNHIEKTDDFLGKRLAHDFGVETRRVSDGKILRRWPSQQTHTLNFSPDGSALLSVISDISDSGFRSTSFQIAAFDAKTGREKWRYGSGAGKDGKSSPYWFSDAHFSPDGKLVAAIYYGGSKVGGVFLLDAQSGELVRTLNLGDQNSNISYRPNALAWSPDSKRLYARGQSAVLVWDLD